jgi:hypothetical protein
MLSICKRRFLTWLDGLSEDARELTIRLIMVAIVAMSGLLVALFFDFVFRAHN